MIGIMEAVDAGMTPEEYREHLATSSHSYVYADDPALEQFRKAEAARRIENNLIERISNSVINKLKEEGVI